MVRLLTVLAFLTLGAPAWAGQPAPDAAVDATVKKARQALLDGKPEEAAALAGSILAKLPSHPEAAAIEVEAHAANLDVEAALASVDRFVDAGGKLVRPLLVPVGRGELRALTASDQPFAAVGALERLARSGDAPARDALKKESTAGQGLAAMAATEALGRMGDARARGKLIELARQPVGPAGRTAALRVLYGSTAPEVVQLYLDLLTDRDPIVRATAIEGLGRAGVKTSVDALRKQMADRLGLIQMAAGAALLRLGDAAGRNLAIDALASPLPEFRLTAAQALAETGDNGWVAAIRPLLDDPNGLTRFVAAELLLAHDRKAAVAVLEAGAKDPNPVIRTEAARLMAPLDECRPEVLRRWLSDASPMVRLQAAGALADTKVPAEAADKPQGRR